MVNTYVIPVGMFGSKVMNKKLAFIVSICLCACTYPSDPELVGENEAPAEDVEDDVAVAPARSSNPAPSTRT